LLGHRPEFGPGRIIERCGRLHVDLDTSLQVLVIQAIGLGHRADDPEPVLLVQYLERIDKQIAILKKVKGSVKIPVSVKLSPFYANPLNIVSQMDQLGVKGFVLFNRLFQPDIDIKKEAHYTPLNASNREDNKLSLRFAGLLYGSVTGSICSSTGIHTGEDVVKMILAGADCVQIVSTVYKNKIEYISTIIEDIQSWMKSKNYSKLADFRGKLSNKNLNDPFVYKRAQYIDLLLNSDQIFKKYPTV